jgi:gliding motility-associated-like protein
MPAHHKIFESKSFTSGRYDIKTEGIHRLYLNSTLGCDSIVDLDLSFYKIYIPNAFSPNNDGINDRFFIDIDDPFVQIDYLNIYNRWGQLIHSSNFNVDSSMPSWNGMTANNIIESGTYTYAIGFSDGYGSKLHLTGSLLLYR